MTAPSVVRSVLAINGPSGAGKTTWLSRVIESLARLNAAPAVVKTCHHAPDIEPRRKDSARHLEAGATAVLLASRTKIALTRRTKETVADEIRRFVDTAPSSIILIEGGQETDFPKIAVNSTGIEWSKSPPFPVLAYAGRREMIPAVCDRNWSNPEAAADEILGWHNLRKRTASVLGVILSGGEGKRLGGLRKGALLLDNLRLDDRAFRMLRTFLHDVRLSTPRADERASSESGAKRSGNSSRESSVFVPPPPEIPLLLDPPGIAGPVAGVAAAVEFAEKNNASGILLLGVDHCRLPLSALESLLRIGLDGLPAVASSQDGLTPTICFFPRNSFSNLRNAISAGARSLKALFSSLDFRPLPLEKDLLQDIDTPEDIERLGIKISSA
ncbi:MAG: molybdopterin-guanine dinucleotide biosynthesis protein B [Candidatus Hydrogenedentota bacterium]|nr:MAG: molybdopterin-guanine dinucleotide biosynthesis protein B [Candidatus Hydrogenedentota bacterium]